jgi:transposase
MKTVPKYSPEVRERAVRMVFERQAEHESQWAAIVSIAGKIGCTPESLRQCVRQAERDKGKRVGLTSTERERLKQLERELGVRCEHSTPFISNMLLLRGANLPPAVKF